MNREASRGRWPWLFSAGLLVVAVSLYFIWPPFQSFLDRAYRIITSGDEARIAAWIDELGVVGPVAIVAAMILQMFLILIPSPLLMLVAILAYGPVWGVLLAVTAVLIASSVGYVLGQYLGIATLHRLLGEDTAQRLRDQVQQYGAWTVVLVRLIPFLSNDAISFLGGFLGMSYLKFIVATAVGITPLAVLLAYLGEHFDRMPGVLWWLAAAVVLIFFLYELYRRRR